jgi:hypothetical protein
MFVPNLIPLTQAFQSKYYLHCTASFTVVDIYIVLIGGIIGDRETVQRTTERKKPSMEVAKNEQSNFRD